MLGNQLQIGSQPPPLTLGRPSTQMYTKKARKQHWETGMRDNKKLETELLLKGFDIRRESRSFLLTLKGIQSVQVTDVFGKDQLLNGAKLSLKYYITFYNREIPPMGNFYGRTFTSQAIVLKEAAGILDTAQEDFVYFHTSYTEKTSFIIIECVVMKEIMGQISYGSAGYALCKVFDFAGVTTVEISRGSPRSIGLLGIDAVSEKASKSMGKITYELRDFPAFEKLKMLIPQNNFVGMGDMIPGLKSEYFPNPRQGSSIGKVGLEILPSTTIYIHNLQLVTSMALETRFENFLKKMKLEQAKGTTGTVNSTTDNVYITERRILVSANNTWKNISEETYVSMGPPNDKGISNSGGSLTIKNFICHPLVALLFRIEYKAEIPNPKGRQQVYFTLGWTGHIPSYNAEGGFTDESIDCDFELGPGKAPSGDLLWDPNSDEINFYQIKLTAHVSSNAVAPHVPGAQSMSLPGKAPALAGNDPRQLANLQGPQGKHVQTPQELEAIAQRDRQMKDLQQQLHIQQLKERELQMQLEQRETAFVQNSNQWNQNQWQDPNQRHQEDQMRLAAIQKEQMQHELDRAKQEYHNYLQSMKESMQPPQYHQQQQQQQMPSYGQFTEALSTGSQQQIAMIGNVFYNMLNLIGETEKDKRIIGLSDNLKKMVQTQKFDDLLAPKVPFIGMGQINLLKTTDLPLQDQINFIKMGFGDVLQLPSSQLTTQSFQKDKMSLDVEIADPLKASTLTFKFLCLKTPWVGIEKFPAKFYFEFKFFTFPSVMTDKVKIKNHLEAESKSIIAGTPYYLQKVNFKPMAGQQNELMSDSSLLSVTFEIDPSVSKIKDENIKCAEYLKDRFLTVDVFDGDSLFLYGTCKIPLFELMRQGRGNVVRAKECELCDPETGDFKGALQLIMSNSGKMQAVTIQDKDSSPSPQKSRVQPSQGGDPTKQHKYKKVVKSKPMDLTKMQQSNNTGNLSSTHTGLAQSQNHNMSILSQTNQASATQASMYNADLRKKLRVDRVRKMTMGQTSSHISVEDPSQPDWAKFKSLREIEMIRETKKEQILNRVLDDYSQGSEQLSIVPGITELLSIPISNSFNQNEVYTVHINDPDDQMLQEKELQLVTDVMEWRHWVAQGKCKKPVSYEIITPQCDVLLQPGDSVDLLFKFISFREASFDKNVLASPEVIKARKIQVIILQSNQQPFSTFEINIVPSSTPIDHTFRFYEPQNSYRTISIPPFLSLNHPGLTAKVSRPSALVDIKKDTSKITIETRTGEAPEVVDMILFIYGDEYHEKLLAACKIELYSLVAIYQQLKAGIQATQSLSLPAEAARNVQIYSSNPELVYLPNRALNQTFRIIPQTVNHIQICAKTLTSLQQKVRIHCTDNVKGDLVYAWLLILDSDAPTITKKHQLECKMNLASVQQIPFANRLNLKTIYEFATSDKNFCEVRQNAVTFEAKESKILDLYFPPQPRYGTAEVYLFINDHQYNVVECHQLKISYLP